MDRPTDGRLGENISLTPTTLLTYRHIKTRSTSRVDVCDPCKHADIRSNTIRLYSTRPNLEEQTTLAQNTVQIRKAADELFQLSEMDVKAFTSSTLPSPLIQARTCTPPYNYAPFGVSGLVPFSHCDWLKVER
ncbi:hypothetical protein EVAR_62923_1 [Eumeta japonica]|uniref:Uncharacterized protein n=1 Tax=Eumeta variegata TaxID=151549 RepID=A0A4C1ZQR3_EUMVA|nr:hypothetical protein EVAR_62923_1 [Eumeta japonica]